MQLVAYGVADVEQDRGGAKNNLAGAVDVKNWGEVLNNLTSTEVIKPNLDDTATDKNIRVYAPNYNVLRIMSMGGLAYSN